MVEVGLARLRDQRQDGEIQRFVQEQLLLHPEEIAKFDPVALRRVVAYVLLRWLDDYTADLRGEYFPFDLANLAFYRRGIQLGQLVGELVASVERLAPKN